MKKLLILMVSFLSFAMTQAKEVTDTTVVFTIQAPLHCTNCEKKVTENLRFEKGVKKIVASHKNNTVTITYDKKKTDCAKLQAAFSKIGKKAEVVK